eukprot:TRINITY_DN10428_c0_g1_i10.p1 TRINITY_DN10428_c0_g1~~TRINITY_DN10428_c0_g1_i10.p1  ORF type:complete len:119 (+),score=5.10 TRINITY_DN10428_c0_g1_i10:89-445(+)
MIRRPPRSTLSSSSAASDVYKRQINAEYGDSRHRHVQHAPVTDHQEAFRCCPRSGYLPFAVIRFCAPHRSHRDLTALVTAPASQLPPICNAQIKPSFLGKFFTSFFVAILHLSFSFYL